MFSKSRLMTVGLTLGVLALINRVGALKPAKDLVNG